MKKLLSILLALTALFSIWACNPTNATPPETSGKVEIGHSLYIPVDSEEGWYAEDSAVATVSVTNEGYIVVTGTGAGETLIKKRGGSTTYTISVFAPVVEEKEITQE